MIELLVTLVVVCIIVGLVLYVVDAIPMPPPIEATTDVLLGAVA